ncbi:MAG TPA: hypothetical protein VGH74_20265 [Planctomycetaceae bacterium]|jgi:hypothetical protein
MIALAALLLVAPHVAVADDEQPTDEQPTEAPATDNDARRCRAGNPQCTAWYARGSYRRNYAAYYVGGGAPLCGGWTPVSGEARYSNEGTFGMDYAPWYSRVNLAWYHGRRYQGGRGQYEPNRLNSGFPNFFRR